MGEKCSRPAFDFQRFGPHGSSLFKLLDATPGLWLFGWTPSIAGEHAEVEGSFYGTSHWNWRGLLQGARPWADGGLVIWFFMAVAYLIMDPRKRGPIQICLTIVFLILGLLLIVYGSKRSAK